MNPQIEKILNIFEEYKHNMKDNDYKEGLETLGLLVCEKTEYYKIRIMLVKTKVELDNDIFDLSPEIEYQNHIFRLTTETYIDIKKNLRDGPVTALGKCKYNTDIFMLNQFLENMRTYANHERDLEGTAVEFSVYTVVLVVNIAKITLSNR